MSWFMRSWFTRKRLRAAFGDFLPEDALDALAQRELSIPPLQRTRLCHVLLQVRDDTAETIPKSRSDAVELILREGAIVESVLSSFVSAVFPLETDTPLDPIKATLDRLGPNVRAVYCFGDHLRGVIASPSHVAYGTVVPSMGAAMERLLRLEFGSIEQFGDEAETV
ncbi:hypothetical protein LQG66_30930 [Bradyrhizobium ontarionense]|uniref:Uncharacterized protein n=1 Tax=Bradyrhizobium ontarionense TaxID=2898149 RepID=A0ABY3R8S1_9BRAD|nr:hypothetical protein [Bradyrhizobium sp. A19]UFZ03589.1 hypothetical protein LQG66_30930 [Bradyrhizobium sp. A19]